MSRKDALHCGGGAFSFCRSSCRCGHAQLVSFSCSYSIDNEERGKVLFSREGNLGRPASLKCWHASATPPVSISPSVRPTFIRRPPTFTGHLTLRSSGVRTRRLTEISRANVGSPPPRSTSWHFMFRWFWRRGGRFESPKRRSAASP